MPSTESTVTEDRLLFPNLFFQSGLFLTVRIQTFGFWPAKIQSKP